MRNPLLVAIAASALGVAAIAWLRTPDAPIVSHAPPPESSRASDERIEQLQAEVAALREELARMESAAGNARAPMPPAVKDDALGDAVLPTLPSETADAAAAPPPGRDLRASNVTNLERRLASETTDSAWSVNAETEFANGLRAADLTGTSLVGVQCRRTLCRIDVSLTDSDAEEAFFNHLPALPGMQETEIFYTRDSLPDGATQLVLYVARQGQSLGVQ